MSKVFVAKELFICTGDGAGEVNILGLFKNKQDAINAIKERIKEYGPSFPECDVVASESLLNFYREINSTIDERHCTIGDSDAFCVGSIECWYEYYLELIVEEKEIQ